jgi:penicillin-binding protein 1A
MGVWLGNPDTTILKKGTSSLGSPIVASVMEYAHKEVYAKEGKWKSGDWYSQPKGIQRIGKEVYPSWWNKTQGQSNSKLTFDKLSRKKATKCTPDAAKITLDVLKTTDPVTKKDSYGNIPDGYNAKEDDDKHSCSDDEPKVSSIEVSGNDVTFTVTPGTFEVSLSGITVSAGGTSLTVVSDGNGNYTATSSTPITGTATVNVTDSGYYTTSGSGSS